MAEMDPLITFCLILLISFLSRMITDPNLNPLTKINYLLYGVSLFVLMIAFMYLSDQEEERRWKRRLFK